MQLEDFFYRDRSVIWCAEEGLSQARLLAQAAAVREAIAARGLGAAPDVALACRELVNFVPGLLGAWMAGATVQLLPNTQPDTLRRAYATSAVFLHDVEQAQDHSPADLFLPPVISSESARQSVALGGASEGAKDECARAAVVFATSGTTGAPGRSRKSTRQLWDETNGLAELVQGARHLLSTVPAFHLYGLLFGILAPLRHGVAVVRRQAFLPADVASVIAALDVDLLISTPPHLAAMRHSIMPKARRVISSGAPLPMELHLALSSAHQWTITDVLGSTETGGMATRTSPLAPWQPMPGVRVSVDGELVWLTSPWCDGGRCALADRIELLPGGRFLHLGRTDAVVKIGGKRVDLAVLEDLLKRQPGVQDAAVYHHQRSHAEGRLYYALAGVGIDVKQIRAAVSREFDPVVAPRQIVVCERLPRDAVGKLPRAALGALFVNRTRAHARDVALLQQGDQVLCDVPRDYVFFDGHFPALAVLPGAVTLQRIVIPSIRRLVPGLGPVAALRRCRFMRPVLPGQRLVTTCKVGEGGIAFEVTCLADVVARGVVSFAVVRGAA